MDRTSPVNTGTIDTDGENQSEMPSVSGGVLATPAVRSLAKQHGLDINQIRGTGKEGRVLKEDVLNYAISKGLICTSDTDKVETFIEGSESRGSFVSTSAYQDTTIPLRYQISIRFYFQNICLVMSLD